MPPKKAASSGGAASKKTEQKKKEKVIEVNGISLFSDRQASHTFEPTQTPPACRFPRNSLLYQVISKLSSPLPHKSLNLCLLMPKF